MADNKSNKSSKSSITSNSISKKSERSYSHNLASPSSSRSRSTMSLSSTSRNSNNTSGGSTATTLDPKIQHSVDALQWAEKRFGKNTTVTVGKAVAKSNAGINQVLGWAKGDKNVTSYGGLMPLHLQVSARIHHVTFLHPSLDPSFSYTKLLPGCEETGGEDGTAVIGVKAEMIESETRRLSRDGVVGDHFLGMHKHSKRSRNKIGIAPSTSLSQPIVRNYPSSDSNIIVQDNTIEAKDTYIKGVRRILVNSNEENDNQIRSVKQFVGKVEASVAKLAHKNKINNSSFPNNTTSSSSGKAHLSYSQNFKLKAMHHKDTSVGSSGTGGLAAGSALINRKHAMFQDSNKTMSFSESYHRRLSVDDNNNFLQQQRMSLTTHDNRDLSMCKSSNDYLHHLPSAKGWKYAKIIMEQPNLAQIGRYLPEISCRIPKTAVHFEIRNEKLRTKTTQPFVVEAPHVIWGEGRDALLHTVGTNECAMVDARPFEYKSNEQLTQVQNTESLLFILGTVWVQYPPKMKTLAIKTAPELFSETLGHIDEIENKAIVTITDAMTNVKSPLTNESAQKDTYSLQENNKGNKRHSLLKRMKSKMSVRNNHNISSQSLQTNNNGLPNFDEYEKARSEGYDHIISSNNSVSTSSLNSQQSKKKKRFKFFSSKKKSNHTNDKIHTKNAVSSPSNDTARINNSSRSNSVRKYSNSTSKTASTTINETLDTTATTNTYEEQNNNNNVLRSSFSKTNEKKNTKNKQKVKFADDVTQNDNNTTASSMFHFITSPFSSRFASTKKTQEENVMEQEMDKDKESTSSSSLSLTLSIEQYILEETQLENSSTKIEQLMNNYIGKQSNSVSGRGSLSEKFQGLEKLQTPQKASKKYGDYSKHPRSSSTKERDDRKERVSDVKRKERLSDNERKDKISDTHIKERLSGNDKKKTLSDSELEKKKHSLQEEDENNTKQSVEVSETAPDLRNKKMSLKSASKTVIALGTDDLGYSTGQKKQRRFSSIKSLNSHQKSFLSDNLGASLENQLSSSATTLQLDNRTSPAIDNNLEDDSSLRSHISSIDSKRSLSTNSSSKQRIQQIPYILVLDDKLELRVVDFPGGDVLATFPVSVAAILNQRNLEDRLQDPWEPSELTITLVQEPSIAKLQWGVEVTVTFRCCEIKPKKPLSIDAPTLDTQGGKKKTERKLHELAERLRKSGKSEKVIENIVTTAENNIIQEDARIEAALLESSVYKSNTGLLHHSVLHQSQDFSLRVNDNSDNRQIFWDPYYERLKESLENPVCPLIPKSSKNRPSISDDQLDSDKSLRSVRSKDNEKLDKQALRKTTKFNRLD